MRFARRAAFLLTIITIGFFQIAHGQHYETLNSNTPMSETYWNDFTLEAMEKEFNRGRTEENKQLGTNLPEIQFPDSAKWATMSPDNRIMWLINEEREARGLTPFSGIDYRVQKVASDYAGYLAKHDTIGHYADGNRPTDRLKTNDDLNNCMEHHWENLFHAASQNNVQIRNFTGFALYNFLYNNAGNNWEHRNEILRKNYNDNSGEQGHEGILGIGIRKVDNFELNGTTYKKAAILVINGVDPCSSISRKTSGIAGAAKNADVSVYPNPADHSFQVNHPEKVRSVIITDGLGRVVSKHRSPGDVISVDRWDPGLYNVRLQTESGTLIERKLLVQ